MAIHNKSHHNSGLMQLNRLSSRKEKQANLDCDKKKCCPKVCLKIDDCLSVLKSLPDKSVQLIIIDPPYNLDLEKWDSFPNYMDWASAWINEAYRVLSDKGSLVIFGGTQFGDERSGDLVEIIYYCRHFTKLRLVNTIVWHYKNGMSAHRFFANRHEEAVWFTKSKDYFFDLDSVREKYSEEDLKLALKDKRLNPDNVKKGKNPTNVWEIGRLNGNSLERVGHPTQKPLEIIRRFVKSLSFEGAVVLDFFAGSGTTGRVCIEESRHCIMCDSSDSSKAYFEKHLQNMDAKYKKSYKVVNCLKSVFENEA